MSKSILKAANSHKNRDQGTNSIIMQIEIKQYRRKIFISRIVQKFLENLFIVVLIQRICRLNCAKKTNYSKIWFSSSCSKIWQLIVFYYEICCFAFLLWHFWVFFLKFKIQNLCSSIYNSRENSCYGYKDIL